MLQAVQQLKPQQSQKFKVLSKGEDVALDNLPTLVLVFVVNVLSAIISWTSLDKPFKSVVSIDNMISFWEKDYLESVRWDNFYLKRFAVIRIRYMKNLYRMKYEANEMVEEQLCFIPITWPCCLYSVGFKWEWDNIPDREEDYMLGIPSGLGGILSIWPLRSWLSLWRTLHQSILRLV